MKLLKKFLSARRDEAGTEGRMAEDRSPRRPNLNRSRAEIAEGKAEVGDQDSEFGHSRVCETAEGKLTRIDTDKSERLSADRTGGMQAPRETRHLRLVRIGKCGKVVGDKLPPVR